MKVQGTYKDTLTTFELTEYDEVEEDNRKIWHHVRISYDESRTYLNHTPYEHVTETALRGYVRFYQSHGRFPRYGELDVGNCTNKLMEDFYWATRRAATRTSALSHRGL